MGSGEPSTSKPKARSLLARRSGAEVHLLVEDSGPGVPDADLLVFPDGKYPPSALAEADFTEAWTKSRRDAFEKLRPTDAASFTNFMNIERTALRHVVGTLHQGEEHK
mgnify:CR=1 FL=1